MNGSWQQRLLDTASGNPHNRALLAGLPQLGLPDAWLVAGCLFNAVWNAHLGRAPGDGVNDYDIFYFDGSDLSAEAEARHQRHADALFASLNIPIEVKNQARVHTWYEAWFGHPYRPLASACEGIDRFLAHGTRVGINAAGRVYAGDGERECRAVFAGELRPNPLCDHPELFDTKVIGYCRRWPHLRVLPRHEGATTAGTNRIASGPPLCSARC